MTQALTTSPRAIAARYALLAAALLGVLADPLLRNGSWGLGLLAWMLACAVTFVVLMRLVGRTLSHESSAWLAVAVLFSAGLSWHDADMLQSFDVLAALTALVLLAMSTNTIPVPSLAVARVRDLIQAGVETGVDIAVGALLLVGLDAQMHTAFRSSGDGKARRVGRALVIAVPIFVLFAVLLINADPIFGSLIKLPRVNFNLLLLHTLTVGFFAWIVAGWLRRALVAQPPAAGAATMPLPLALGVTDVSFALGALTLLFAAFVIVQIGWLFGGEALVLKTTGLSYANYARHGFFELTWVAALLLAILLGAQALIPAADLGTLRRYRRLALPLVVLLGAIIFSAGARMKLYIQYYGISTDRLYASAFMIWLALVFLWLTLTVLRSRPRAFAAGFVISGFVVLATLNMLDPDALVARANLARGEAGHAGAGSDLRYIASLGGDAVPMLVATLTRSTVVGDSATSADRCAAARILLQRWTGVSATAMGRDWTEWNLARMRALQAIRARESELQQLACARTPDKP